jgi:peptidoglycan/LPS O-acetylase OafA/YrhL
MIAVDIGEVDWIFGYRHSDFGVSISHLNMKSLREYRPDIDGLRAVAVIGVVLFHAELGFTGGYVGVDVFFVISGFLITKLILQEQAAGRFTLTGFWERRIRRIFPALAFAIGGTLVVGMVILFPSELIELAKSAMAQLILGSNFYFWRHSGYFDTPAEMQPLLHTWSLAVEEQFYLGFPFLLVACKRLSRRGVQYVLGAIFLTSFLLSVWGSYARPTATFYLLPPRAWELLTGALLATASAEVRVPRRIAESLSWIGLATILLTFWIYGTRTRFPGASALFPCMGTAMVIWSNTKERTTVGKLLSLRPIVFIGLISYSLYLWHWPILVYMRYRVAESPAISLRLAAILISFLLACLSWRYIETPFRRRSNGTRTSVVFATALAVMGSLFVISAAAWRLHGIPQRYPEEIVRFVEENEFPHQFATTRLELVQDDQLPILGTHNGLNASFLLWGDSQAQSVGLALDKLAAQYKLWGYVAANPGITPVLGTWRPSVGKQAVNWNQAVLDFFRRMQIKHVLLVSDWEINVQGRQNGSLDSLIVDDERQAVSTLNAADVMRRDLVRTVGELERAGATVWVMRQVPIQRQIPSELAFDALIHGQKLPEFGVSLQEHLSRQKRLNDFINQSQLQTARIIDPVEVFFVSQKSLISENGRSYYVDRSHLTIFGAQQLITRLFEPVFRQIAEESASTIKNGSRPTRSADDGNRTHSR